MSQAAHEPTTEPHDAVEARVSRLPWSALTSELDTRGVSRVPALLTPDECASLVGAYPDTARFPRRVLMARHGYGRGEYQYFADPLPAVVSALREATYAPLVPLANARHERMRLVRRFPASLRALHEECAALGQLPRVASSCSPSSDRAWTRSA